MQHDDKKEKGASIKIAPSRFALFLFSLESEMFITPSTDQYISYLKGPPWKQENATVGMLQVYEVDNFVFNAAWLCRSKKHFIEYVLRETKNYASYISDR